ncbi:hypothetical protein [Actinophytocola sp. NPDC049390]|uniref:hypothetical protein n=1 Tax=Actinophytocola sp. NPDC049390 TaxID=3363894 RepID=UPI00379741CC
MTERPRFAGWVAGLLASGVLFFFAVEFYGSPPEDDPLRYTSVHVESGADGVLEVERTRRIVGDRPIVVVATGSGTRCRDVVEAVPDVIALVLRHGGVADDCAGAAARHHHGDLLYEAERAGRDGTGLVEEYVRAFDALFAGEPLPRRSPPPADTGPDVGDVLVLVATALFAAVFVLAAVAVVRTVRWDERDDAARTRHRRARADARLNRLADRVLRFDRPADSAVAKRYVLVLRDFEAATTERQRVAVDTRLTDLEREVGVLSRR